MKRILKTTAQQLMLLSGLLLMACQQGSNPTTTEATCMKLTAQQAGEQIVDIYRTAITETAKLVENQPDAATIEAQFDALLNRWQKKLLSVGQHVMVMNGAEKSQVESAITKVHMEMQYNEQAKQQFTAYTQSTFPYHSTAPDFYLKLKSINIITQFAFFDLLKKQNKDAMEKWGHLMVPFECSE